MSEVCCVEERYQVGAWIVRTDKELHQARNSSLCVRLEALVMKGMVKAHLLQIRWATQRVVEQHAFTSTHPHRHHNYGADHHNCSYPDSTAPTSTLSPSFKRSIQLLSIPLRTQFQSRHHPHTNIITKHNMPPKKKTPEVADATTASGETVCSYNHHHDYLLFASR